jgi:hypothetical protein
MKAIIVLAAAVAIVACSSTPPSMTPSHADLPTNANAGLLARVYYWRARPGKLAEYNRYIRDIAAPIDEEARRRGAFISVTTYTARDTTLPWTHMRIFVLRDSAQLAGLSAALTAAGIALQPDSVKRRQQSEYSATLRDAVGNGVMDIVR